MDYLSWNTFNRLIFRICLNFLLSVLIIHETEKFNFNLFYSIQPNLLDFPKDQKVIDSRYMKLWLFPIDLLYIKSLIQAHIFCYRA
jgi:hypothetical protein